MLIVSQMLYYSKLEGIEWEHFAWLPWHHSMDWYKQVYICLTTMNLIFQHRKHFYMVLTAPLFVTLSLLYYSNLVLFNPMVSFFENSTFFQLSSRFHVIFILVTFHLITLSIILSHSHHFPAFARSPPCSFFSKVKLRRCDDAALTNAYVSSPYYNAANTCKSIFWVFLLSKIPNLHDWWILATFNEVHSIALPPT